MTAINTKKCSLYIKSNGTVEYTIVPCPDQTEFREDYKIYNFNLDLTKTHTIKIEVNDCAKESWLHVDHIKLNDTVLDDINCNSVFVTKDNQIKKNSGWIDSTGTFFLRIHTNIVSQNFLNYLFTLTKSAT